MNERTNERMNDDVLPPNHKVSAALCTKVHRAVKTADFTHHSLV